jgi:hypothetical protein
VCEFVGQNYNKSAENNGYVEVDINNPQQVAVSMLNITEEEQPKLYALLVDKRNEKEIIEAQVMAMEDFDAPEKVEVEECITSN